METKKTPEDCLYCKFGGPDPDGWALCHLPPHHFHGQGKPMPPGSVCEDFQPVEHNPWKFTRGFWRDGSPLDWLKDLMWMHLIERGQKPNLRAFKGYCHDIIQAMCQMNGGERSSAKSDYASFADLTMLNFSVICEATALVRSGVLDALDVEEVHEGDMQELRVRGTHVQGDPVPSEEQEGEDHGDVQGLQPKARKTVSGEQFWMHDGYPWKAMSRHKCTDALSSYWSFLRPGGQQADIPALKAYVNELVGLTWGRREPLLQELTRLDELAGMIVMESMCLVLSGDLEKLEGKA